MRLPKEPKEKVEVGEEREHAGRDFEPTLAKERQAEHARPPERRDQPERGKHQKPGRRAQLHRA